MQKKCTKEPRGRTWSGSELKEFASVLVDDQTIKTCVGTKILALKRAANVYANENIKKELNIRKYRL